MLYRYLIIFTILFSSSISAYDWYINVTQNEYGELLVGSDITLSDTVTFSTGTVIRFAKIHNGIMNGGIVYGFLIIEDTVSNCFYSGEAGLETVIDGDTANEQSYVGYLNTNNSTDIIWENAKTVSDNETGIDTVFYKENPDYEKKKNPARSLFIEDHQINAVVNLASSTSGYNTIIYVIPKDNIKMKLQISDITIDNSGKQQYVTSYKFRWSVDIDGDGYFATDTSVIKSRQSKNALQDIRIFQNRNTIQLIPLNNILIKSATLYSLSGKRVKGFNKESKEMKITGIGCGTYFLRLHTSEGIIVNPIIINRN